MNRLVRACPTGSSRRPNTHAQAVLRPEDMDQPSRFFIPPTFRVVVTSTIPESRWRYLHPHIPSDPKVIQSAMIAPDVKGELNSPRANGF